MGGKGGGNVKGMKDIARVQESLGKEQNQIARQYLAQAQKQYADNKVFTSKVLDVQLPAMQEQLKAGREDRSRYLQYFAPLEEKFATQASTYDTPARREAEAGRSVADVSAAAESQRQQAAQALESFGIDPSMTRAQALDRQVGISTAAQQAGAANTARQNVEARGLTLEQQAINVGRGFPGQALQETQGAVNTGGAAMQSQMAAGGQLNQGYNTASNYFGGASNALQGAAQTRTAIDTASNRTPWLDAASLVAGTAAGAAAGKAFGAEGGTGEQIAMRNGPPGEHDAVPAVIARDEYVVPRDVVRAKGVHFFENLVDKTRGSGRGGKPDRPAGIDPSMRRSSNIIDARGPEMLSSEPDNPEYDYTAHPAPSAGHVPLGALRMAPLPDVGPGPLPADTHYPPLPASGVERPPSIDTTDQFQRGMEPLVQRLGIPPQKMGALPYESSGRAHLPATFEDRIRSELSRNPPIPPPVPNPRRVGIPPTGVNVPGQKVGVPQRLVGQGQPSTDELIYDTLTGGQSPPPARTGVPTPQTPTPQPNVLGGKDTLRLGQAGLRELQRRGAETRAGIPTAQRLMGPGGPAQRPLPRKKAKARKG